VSEVVKFVPKSKSADWREIERELADLFQSFGRCTVFEIDGEPHVEFVRSHEPAEEDGTIYVAGLNKLSLTFLARHLATRFRGPL
jgi:hypothetical protein